MKKSSISSNNSTFVQIDILTSFKKWNNRIKLKMDKKNNVTISPLVIEINSDSESDEEESNNQGQPTDIKRELPVPFTDDEEDDLEDNPAIKPNPGNDDSEIGVPKEAINVSQTEPLASSTPLKSSTPLNSHVSADTSSVVNQSSDTIDAMNSAVSTNSECTIIYTYPESSPNKSSKVILKEQIIVSPSTSKKSAMGKSDQTKVVDNLNPDKKRPSESDRAAKKQKICQADVNSQKSKEFNGENLTKQKENATNSTPTKNKNRINNAKQPSANLKAEASPSPKKKSRSDPEQQKCGGANKNTDKENECQHSPNAKETPIKDATPSSSSSTQKSVHKQYLWTSNQKSEELNGKKWKKLFKEKEKATNSTPTKNRINKFKPSRAYLKAEAAPSPRKKSHSNPEHQKCGGSNKPTDKEDECQHSPKAKKIPIEDATSSSSSSPQKSIHKQNLELKSKKEGKKLDLKPVSLITELFKTVYHTRYLKNLVTEDKTRIKIFFNMEPKYQYVCLKLFSRKRKWYNLFKLCNLLYLDVEDCDVTNMYEVFKEKKIVDTDYLKDDIAKLLILLDPTDLKDLCKIFKSKLMSSRKEDMIQSLLKFCRTQSTLTNLKSTEDLIKEQIKLKMGDCCIKLNGEFEEAFYRTYILGTFTNSTFTNMVDYFKNLLYLNVLFPNYQVEEYLIFYSTGEFIRYARARRCRDELEKYAGNHLETLKICKSMFEELKAIKDVEVFDEDRYKKSPHLTRFTARSVYVSGLTSATKTLATKFPEDVKEWLEYMIENESMYTHRIGDWYFHLTWLYMKYLKPFDYTRAAQLLIEVLQEQQDHLSEIQLYQLSKRGDLLRVTKKYKIDQWYHDKIAKLTPPPIHYYDFPRHEIDAQAIRENQSGRKRDYVICDGDGNKRILGVEELALRYYLNNGYTDGGHCEGSLIKAIFTLFFWDIIYTEKPGSFVSNIQCEPLDMVTKYFYLRRKDEIDKRLAEIELGWSRDEVINWLNNNYDLHSHKLGFCEVGAIITEKKLLEILVDCIGRKVLAGIFKRFVTNIKDYRKGMPDLLVWNEETKKSKFVEVKGENDKLSIAQSLWIKHLKTIGADVEVCLVHSIGSKRKKKF